MIKYILKKLLLKLKYKARIDTVDVSLSSKISHHSIIRKGCEINDSKIGKYAYININTIIHKSQVGDFCSIGPHCLIGLNEHLYSYPTTSNNLYPDNIMKQLAKHNEEKTYIGPDVWIGGNVFIKKGVKIGIGSVIAAGSVVTKNVEPYTIVAGVPAKLIHYRFEKNEINLLLKSKWWNNSVEEIYEALNKSYGSRNKVEVFCSYF